MTESLVIIPTYNEKENIEKMIRKVFSYSEPFHLLIVEDNSPDGTASIVKKLMLEFPERLFILEREGKQGLGTAYIAGFKWALQRSYHYICEMDADFSHNPDDLHRLFMACRNGADVAVGSRYSQGVNVVNWPMSRVLMSYFASMYVRFITGMKVRDTTAGFVCYSRKVLETIKLDKIKFKGYAFQIEMKFTAWKLGFRIDEVPIIRRRISKQWSVVSCQSSRRPFEVGRRSLSLSKRTFKKANKQLVVSCQLSVVSRQDFHLK